MVSAEDARRTDSLHHECGGPVPFPPATSRPGPSRLLVIRPASLRPRTACLPPERLSIMAVWGYSSIGRALRSHRRGRGFESPYLHQHWKLEARGWRLERNDLQPLTSGLRAPVARPRSSGGQSSGFLNRGSQVRVLPGVPPSPRRRLISRCQIQAFRPAHRVCSAVPCEAGVARH